MNFPKLSTQAGFTALLCAFTLHAADGPSVFYSRTFPGSAPAYFQVSLAKNGAAEYRESPNDENPLALRLSEAETAEVFTLAERLDYFKRPLEAAIKVAFMGTKLMRYENGEQKSEVKFNYSEDPSARALADWFERIGESARYRAELESAMKYDKLGVVRVLQDIQDAINRKRLVGESEFLPALERIVANGSFMHTARERAAEIAGAIRKPKP